ncbi:MAG: tRNA (cytidine(34)-2'-O)-methyltransferase [Lentisphaerales bacterium]|jgi:tRNA (cytidine/uridine-2'-O-)-methyltransferase|nr:MAG: tRNA (cytidine(34)-2'-O)-methyltransferase [Lentisphaerales bacterium]
MTNINVVLVEPEIPHNTGAIGRLCVGLDATLHLIRPLGFHIDDVDVKRAGLDYWEHLDLQVYESWESFSMQTGHNVRLYLSTRGERTIFDVSFQPGVYLVFGSETRGFPTSFYQDYREQLVRIPMPGQHARSMNLANAASVAMYEAYRQIEFPDGEGGDG